MKENEYPNIVHFARTCLQTFEEKPFCEVDSLIFSWLSYLYIHEELAVNFSRDGMPIRDLLKAEHFAEMFNKIWSAEETFDLLVAVVASPRYRNIKLRYYRYEMNDSINLQFSAVVFSLSEECHYVAYRGTDWFLTGWKEDVLMALKDPVPAQKVGVSYLNNVGEVLPGRLYVGGHSKGGNLAVFSAAYCNRAVQDRIAAVYSHDGPGFLKSDLAHEGFARIRDRIHKTVPQASYFGLLFESEAAYHTIQSNGRSIMQHNAITWKVEGDRFAPAQSQTKVSLAAVKKLNHWLDGMNNNERVNFVRGLIRLMDDTQVDSIDELAGNIRHYIPLVMKTLKAMDKEQRQFVLHALRIAFFGEKQDTKKENKKGEIPLQALSKNGISHKKTSGKQAGSGNITDEDDEELAAFHEEFELFILSLKKDGSDKDTQYYDGT